MSRTRVRVAGAWLDLPSGPKGDPGDTGSTGPASTVPGPPGTDGRSILSGVGTPFTVAGSPPTHRGSNQSAVIPTAAQGGDTLLFFTFQNAHLPLDNQAPIIPGWDMLNTVCALDSWNGGGIRFSVFTKTAAGVSGSTSSEAGAAITPSGSPAAYLGGWTMAYSPASGIRTSDNNTPDNAGTGAASLATTPVSVLYSNTKLVQALYNGRGSGGGTLTRSLDGSPTLRQTYGDTHTGIELQDETASPPTSRTATWTFSGSYHGTLFTVALDPQIATAVGNNGDFYIDTSTNTLYGPKAAGVWPSSGIKLDTATAYTPTSSTDVTGKVGDMAYDNSYFYVKAVGGWRRTAISTF